MTKPQQPTIENDDDPYWQNWPQLLTCGELKNPQPVIDAFFNRFCLIDIKACLRDWLFVVYDSKREAAGYVCLCEDLERFIEAVFMTQENDMVKRVREECGSDMG